ncbi:transposable element Tc1 transposase [Trichonephila clavipes]|nr:transposable element Tc1 transposase [Trichonephila clavipes]
MTIHRRLVERNLLLPTATPLATHACTLSSQITLTSQWCLTKSGCNHADRGHAVIRDESRFQLCPDDHRRRVYRRPGQRGDPAFTIVCHTDLQPGVIM